MSHNISDGWLMIDFNEKIVDIGEDEKEKSEDNFFADFQNLSRFQSEDDPFASLDCFNAFNRTSTAGTVNVASQEGGGEQYYNPLLPRSVELMSSSSQSARSAHKPSLPPMRKNQFSGSTSTITTKKNLKRPFNVIKRKQHVQPEKTIVNFQQQQKKKNYIFDNEKFLSNSSSIMEEEDKKKQNSNIDHHVSKHVNPFNWNAFMIKELDGVDEPIEAEYNPGVQNEILASENKKIRALLNKVRQIDSHDTNNLKELKSMRDKLKAHLEFLGDLCRTKNVKMVEKKIQSTENVAYAQKNFKKAKSERKMYKKLHKEYMDELQHTRRFQKFFKLLNNTVDNLEQEHKEKFFEDKAVEVFTYIKDILTSGV